jgi:PAS domain-containing protein
MTTLSVYNKHAILSGPNPARPGRHSNARRLTMSAANNEAHFPEEFFQELFLQAGDGIFLISADSTILEVNPRGCEMLG